MEVQCTVQSTWRQPQWVHFDLKTFEYWRLLHLRQRREQTFMLRRITL